MPPQIYLFFIGYKLKEAEFEEVAYVSGISHVSDDFLTAKTRSKYQTYMPSTYDVWLKISKMMNGLMHTCI